jgi:hypothetical protein
LNPWSILNFFRKNRFADYWSQTGGVPSFLVKLVKAGNINFEAFKGDKFITDSLNVVELGKELKPVPLLFQAGYLTVNRVVETVSASKYFLDFPNLEVRTGLVQLLLSLEPITEPLTAKRQSESMLSSLIKLDPIGFQKSFGAFLAGFPFELHQDNEAYYHSLFRAALLLAGQYPDTEGSVGDGKFDIHFKAPNGPEFIIELKYCPLDRRPEGRLGLTAEELEKMVMVYLGKYCPLNQVFCFIIPRIK